MTGVTIEALTARGRDPKPGYEVMPVSVHISLRKLDKTLSLIGLTGREEIMNYVMQRSYQ